MEARRTERPWGYFITYVENKQATVKLLKVSAGQMTSLQRHKNRDELWFFVSGAGSVTLGKEILRASPGSFAYVRRDEVHRIRAISDVVVVEVSLGEFDEEDIERLEDNYGRANR